MKEIMKCDYDKIASSYDDVRGTSESYVMYWTSQLAEFGELGDNDLVLDIGCGTGRYANIFASSGTRTIVGLDRSRKMLTVAHNKCSLENTSFVLGDCRTMPLKGNSFDVALMVLVAHHIPIDDRLNAYKEVQEALKPKGRFVIMTRSHEQIRESLIALFPGVVEIDTERMPDIQQLKDDLVDAGFNDINLDEVPNYKLYRDRNDFVEKVKQKYISTLTMFDEDEFKERFKTFKDRLKQRFGAEKRLYDPMSFTLICARK
jgi:ubiquinone/menaquinone biosynthesis C-methylase UbiE